MPELPEVETVRRGLAPVLENAHLKTVVVRREKLRIPIPGDLASRLEGARVVTIGRRAKYLLLEMDNAAVALIHLGMSGHMTIYKEPPPPPGPHDHVDFITENDVCVRFTDPRRFGLITLDTSDHVHEHKLLRHLGPDPLSNEFNAIELAARLKGRATSIKGALMDQKTVAGLGNIYVSESLFRAGISPKRKAASVQGGRAEKLAAAIREVLTDAISAGGSSLRDHVSPDGELGYFQHQFGVYGREGEPCPGCTCDWAKSGGIRRFVQSGRSTYYCPARQR
ncbi:MAG: bifunctional DNA-formamidopyrimidine glycosylase/DNA-(apurinic or apyrimidinic site) lyase [Rhodospirillales bacterium]|nr:bifunctional DNA-formamidopyrimidine glycosylase/DNA-(apurinic or apyrimidinic site) lyase [Rhodospirillales bacterium]